MTRRGFALIPILLAQQVPAQRKEKSKPDPEAAKKTWRETEVAPKVRKIILVILKPEEGKLVDSARFVKDLGADSLDFVELIMESEDQFAIEIPDDEAEKVVRVGDLIQCVKKHLAAAKRLT